MLNHHINVNRKSLCLILEKRTYNIMYATRVILLFVKIIVYFLCTGDSTRGKC